MALNKDQIINLYRRRAGKYDLTANLYYIIGVRESRYRKIAVSEMGLKLGDTVVEIGCGTGLNFKYLIKSVGSEGKVIGVDLTDKMLEKAKQRIQRNGWGNIELIHSDAADYQFPNGLNGVISTFALTLMPEYEEIMKKASEALAPGGRMVIADLKMPEKWPKWLVRFGLFITKPFGVTLDLTERKPWEKMKRYFDIVRFNELYGGSLYIATGEKRSNKSL